MFELIFIVSLIVIGFIFGTAQEKRHFETLRVREKALLHMPVQMDQGFAKAEGEVFMVSGSVVIAADYFKTFTSNLKSFFGGRLTTQESLMDRARREAMIRMKESAHAQGAQSIICARLESSFLDQLGIEVFAYGTAVKK